MYDFDIVKRIDELTRTIADLAIENVRLRKQIKSYKKLLKGLIAYDRARAAERAREL